MVKNGDGIVLREKSLFVVFEDGYCKPEEDLAALIQECVPDT